MKPTRALILGLVLLAHHSSLAALDTAQIETLTGLKGTMNDAEGVFKVTAPRTDVPISVDGWTMPPFMGLTSWAAFTEGKDGQVMCAGDLVLFEDEVSAVMKAALDGGLSVTALHNHFFADEPKVYFMHIGGEATVEKLATAVKGAFDAQKQVRSANSQPQRLFGKAFAPEKSAITPAPIEAAFGTKVQAKDGMCKVVIGRVAKMPCGCDMGKEMGVNTWAAFGGTDDNAVVCGDFCVLEDELQNVLKGLSREGIHVVAIHHHMTHEQPRYIFLHYWGKGRADKLAASLKANLETLGKK